MAFAIMTDATKVAPGRVGQEDVSAKIDSLRGPHKTPTSARQSGQVHRAFDRNEDINVFWDRLGCQYGTQQRDTLHTRVSTCSEHEGQYGEKQWAARFGYRR
ncbi:MAG: hypothetical protein WBO12_01795 [Xanthobacteraceae bacterium]|jgi:hypothetical protein